MPPKKGEVNSSRRRKMKEVAETAAPTPAPFPVTPARYFPLHPQPPFAPHFSNSLRFDLNNEPRPNPLHESLSMLSPFKSFTSLLTGSGADDQDPLPPSVVEQNAQVEQIIKSQGENLKRMLADMQQRQYNVMIYEAEERATKRQREKELEFSQVACKKAELEQKEVLLQRETHILQNKVKHLEHTTASLRLALQEAIIRGGKVEGGGCSGDQQQQQQQQQEDVESAYVDPDRVEVVEPIKLDCQACGKRVATMMFWPCRHVCTCKDCDDDNKTCPVCRTIKTTSVEVCLPSLEAPPKAQASEAQ